MALTDKLTAIGNAIRVQSGKNELIPLSQMPEEIINLQSLNFDVVGNPKPTNPKENTIWVNTDVPISSWAIGDFPNPWWSMSEGWVYIHAATSDAGRLDFNALKKNEIWIQPFYAKQYVNGAWVDKPLQIYQGGKWLSIAVDLTMNLDVSNWKTLPNANANHSAINSNGNLVLSASIGYSSVWNKAGRYYAEMIDLTNYKTLVVDGSWSATNANTKIGFTQDLNISDGADCASYFYALNDTGEKRVDVTNLTGNYYLVVILDYGNESAVSCTIKNMKLTVGG